DAALPNLFFANNNPQTWAGSFTYLGSSYDLDMGNGAVTLSTSPIVTVSANTLAVGGAISGSGSTLTKTGTGTLMLTNPNSNIGGGLNVNGGSLVIVSGGKLSAVQASTIGNTASDNGNITVDGSGSRLAVTSALTVGNSGTGSLTVSNGGQVSNFNGFV